MNEDKHILVCSWCGHQNLVSYGECGKCEKCNVGYVENDPKEDLDD